MKNIDTPHQGRKLVRLTAAPIIGCLFAALAIPSRGFGLGVFIAVLFVCAAVLVTRRIAIDMHSIFFLGMAVFLATMAALRDATWVVVLDLSAVFLALAVAVFGGKQGRVLARALPVVFARLPVGFLVFSRGFVAYTPNYKKLHVPSMLRAVVLSVSLILVFGGLFFWSDRGFAKLIQASWPSEIPASLWLRPLILVCVGAFVGALVYSANKGVQRERSMPIDLLVGRRFLGSLEWAVAVVSLNVLFAIFVITQLASFFAGSNHIVQTAGLTYAANAHSGFGQLIVVTLLVLVVVWRANRSLQCSKGRSKVVLQVGLLLLCLLTLVVLFSGLHRLNLYEHAFGLTRLRLVVDAFMVWLGVVILFVCSSVAVTKWQWLPRTIIGFTLIFGVTFSLMNPDGVIAERNVQRLETSGRIDLKYLQSLSADAVPALSHLPQMERDKVFDSYRRKASLRKSDGWRELNLARLHAHAMLF